MDEEIHRDNTMSNDPGDIHKISFPNLTTVYMMNSKHRVGDRLSHWSCVLIYSRSVSKSLMKCNAVGTKTGHRRGKEEVGLVIVKLRVT
jgi:hypothetical protein